jgi:hypothetical protein
MRRIQMPIQFFDTETDKAIREAITCYGPYTFLDGLALTMEDMQTDTNLRSLERYECKDMARRIKEIVYDFVVFQEGGK